MLNPQFFVHRLHLFFVADGERNRFGWAEDRITGAYNLYIAGRHLGIPGALGPHLYLAGKAEACLITDFAEVGERSWVDKDLNDACPISEVHEEQAAQIAYFMRPTVERYLLPGMLRPERAACVRSLEESHGSWKDTLAALA